MTVIVDAEDETFFRPLTSRLSTAAGDQRRRVVQYEMVGIRVFVIVGRD
jgi:hypothetical protein